MTELILIVQEKIIGGYSAKALGVSIFTQGDTTERNHTPLKVGTLNAIIRDING